MQYIGELRRKTRQTVLLQKENKEASLAEKPQNSGLLVNIEYLVSYPIG